MFVQGPPGPRERSGSGPPGPRGGPRLEGSTMDRRIRAPTSQFDPQRDLHSLIQDGPYRGLQDGPGQTRTLDRRKGGGERDRSYENGGDRRRSESGKPCGTLGRKENSGTLGRKENSGTLGRKETSGSQLRMETGDINTSRQSNETLRRKEQLETTSTPTSRDGAGRNGRTGREQNSAIVVKNNKSYSSTPGTFFIYYVFKMLRLTREKIQQTVSTVQNTFL